MSNYWGIAFWAALVISNVWSASESTYGGIFASIWLLFAVGLLVVLLVLHRSEKKQD